MSAQTHIAQKLSEQLPGEQILALESVALKTITAEDIKKNLVKSSLITAATAPLGVGITVHSIPPLAWAVITDKRVVLFATDPHVRRALGPVVFSADRHSVIFSPSGGLLKMITVKDFETGKPVLKMNFGARKKAFTNLVHAFDNHIHQ